MQTVSWGALSVGGILGSLAGGYLTEYNLPYYCFLINAVLGFIICISGFLMDKALENDGTRVEMTLA